MAYYIDYTSLELVSNDSYDTAENMDGGETLLDMTATGESRISGQVGNQEGTDLADFYQFKAEGSVTVTVEIYDIQPFTMVPGWEASFYAQIFNLLDENWAEAYSELIAPDTGLTVNGGVDYTSFSFTLDNMVKEVMVDGSPVEMVYYLHLDWNYGQSNYHLLLDFGGVQPTISIFWTNFVKTRETLT